MTHWGGDHTILIKAYIVHWNTLILNIQHFGKPHKIYNLTVVWRPGSIDPLDSWVVFQTMKILPIYLSDKLISHQEEKFTASGIGQNEQNADMTWGCLGAPEMTWSLGFWEGACRHLRTVTSQAVLPIWASLGWFSILFSQSTDLPYDGTNWSVSPGYPPMVQTRKCVEGGIWVSFILWGQAIVYITLHVTWSFLLIALSGGSF